MSNSLPADELQQCATRIDASIRNVFQCLEAMAGEVVAIWERLQATDARPTSKDLRALQPCIQDNLGEGAPCRMHGTGVVLEPGELADQEMYLEWWYHGRGGKVVPLSLNLNSRSERFYNYLNMPWFSRPRDTGMPSVEGPFVDLYGTDLYILAFSVPIVVNGRFIGVAAADIALQEFEPVLLRSLMRLGNEALVVNGEGRVVAANTANWFVGDMARQALGRGDGQARVLELLGSSSHWAVIERPVSRLQRFH
ncbi:cache domain-containing protein [Pseudomonas sp. QL9]|uniref:Signal transduction protein n=1 Tax=Pseudomonas knackmussii (strain DSM 6978 / CCUG 54928 / LMG 23759 / B13) TaxID=1301098 RepID=A0A024HNZ5_PSEKB|nr:cache domain-containing protein [Pseudomonas knackmussii]CDF86384.1 signal transduction protein [Pseudomonas knackmussii B13]